LDHKFFTKHIYDPKGLIDFDDNYMEKATKIKIRFYTDDVLKRELTMDKGNLPKNIDLDDKYYYRPVINFVNMIIK
jgi:hypothetical protein